MADTNTDSTSNRGGFVFGENMEQRVVKPENETAGDDTENGTNDGESSAEHHSGSLIRPSAFSRGPATGAGVLAPGKLASNPFAPRPSAPSLSQNNSDSEDNHAKGGASRTILRPSSLDKQTVNFAKSATPDKANAFKTTFKLGPAVLKNPFGLDDKEATEESACKPEVAASESEEGKKRLFGDSMGEATKENLWSTKPDGATGDSNASGAAASFVFGQKLESRVVCAASSTSDPKPSGGFLFGQNLADRITKADEKSPDKAAGPKEAACSSTSPAQTLEESAAAHQAKNKKPEVQAVDVKTGEEDESNVFQFNAKLYALNASSQTWIEKGNGLLRLNDMSTGEDESVSFQSRLVMRTTGSLRVVLNTKIWSHMMVEQASPKSIRISAQDGGAVKVFLITANPKDAEQIFKAIDWRVQQLRMKEPKADDSEEAKNEEADKDIVVEIEASLGSLEPGTHTWAEGEPATLQLIDDENSTYIEMKEKKSGQTNLTVTLEDTTDFEMTSPTQLCIRSTEGKEKTTHMIMGSQTEVEKLHTELTLRIVEVCSELEEAASQGETKRVAEKRMADTTGGSPNKKVRLDPEAQNDKPEPDSSADSTGKST